MKRQTLKTLVRHVAMTALVMTAVSVSASPRAVSVRDVNTTEYPDASKIVVPESFETDVHNMMTNWYIKKYAVLDENADLKPSTETTDDDYIERLSRTERVIELPFNGIVRSFIKMYVERKKGLIESMLGMSLYYMPIFENALGKYDLPFELKYLPVIESALNPNAVSKAGAAGLWQFIPSTATDEGLEVNSLVDERRDPYRSSEAAARYLKKLYNTFNDWPLAIAAYNCGPGNVTKAIKRAGGGNKDFWEIYPFLPAETRDYIPAYIAACYAMENYGYHGISPVLAREPIIIDTVNVTRRVHFQQISDVLDIPLEELRILNPQYRQDLIPGNVRPYPLALPHLQVYNYIAQEDTIVNHDADKYARRDVVQPADGRQGSDNKGEYVEETVTKYHKVKRGETIATIAKKYGVTVSSIQRANGMGKRKTLKRGQTIKIITTRRVYKEPEQTQEVTTTTETIVDESCETPESPAVEATATTDSVQTVDTGASNRVSDAMNKSKTKATAKDKPANKPATTTTYTVKSGDNLWKIANAHGLTVDEVKAANGMTNDNITVGQKLKIPTKSTVKSSGKSSTRKKSSRRRR